MVGEMILMAPIIDETMTTAIQTPTDRRYHKGTSHSGLTSLRACQTSRPSDTLMIAEVRDEIAAALLGSPVDAGNHLLIHPNER